MQTSKFKLAVVSPLVVLALAIVVAGCAWVPWIGDLPRSTPGPFGTPGVQMISRDEAIAIARKNADQMSAEGVLQAEIGTWASLRDDGKFGEVPPVPSSDLVWRVTLGYDHGPLDAAGEVLILDATDGRLVWHSFWIA